MATKKSKTVKSPELKWVTLQTVSDNQARINGRLFKACNLMLQYLKKCKCGDPALLKEVAKIIEKIPGLQPPGCIEPTDDKT